MPSNSHWIWHNAQALRAIFHRFAGPCRGRDAIIPLFLALRRTQGTLCAHLGTTRTPQSRVLFGVMQCFSANPEVFEKSIIGIRLLGLILVALNAEQVGGMDGHQYAAT